jgi:hypothetical protein
VSEIEFAEKTDGKTGTLDQALLSRGDYLDLLDLLMSGPIKGGGALESQLVRQAKKAHEIIQEPIRGNYAHRRVFNGKDNVEAAADPADAVLGREAEEGFAKGSGGHGHQLLQLHPIKAVAPLTLEIVKETGNPLFFVGHALVYSKKDLNSIFNWVQER